MVADWQLWLSPRPKTRTNTSKATTITTSGGMALFEFLRDDDGRWVVRETHFMDNPRVRAGLSGPPLHIHFLQTEYFEVKQGVLGVIRNGKEVAVTKDDGPAVIPRGTRHRFWAHESGSEDLIFHVWAEPQDIDHSFDQNFLRNFQGYLADCERAGLQPSFFQIVLTLYEAATILTPSFWVPLWLLKAVHYFIAYGIAKFLLGYEAFYPEYTAEEEFNSDDAGKYK